MRGPGRYFFFGGAGGGRLCSFSVVFGCLSAYFSVTNFPVPESRKFSGPFLLDMTCSFACPALGGSIIHGHVSPIETVRACAVAQGLHGALRGPCGHGHMLLLVRKGMRRTWTPCAKACEFRTPVVHSEKWAGLRARKKGHAFRRSPLISLAERVGFEPTVRLHVRLISSQVHSTTLPPLRKGSRGLREPAILRGGRGRDKRGNPAGRGHRGICLPCPATVRREGMGTGAPPGCRFVRSQAGKLHGDGAASGGPGSSGLPCVSGFAETSRNSSMSPMCDEAPS